MSTTFIFTPISSTTSIWIDIVRVPDGVPKVGRTSVRRSPCNGACCRMWKKRRAEARRTFIAQACATPAPARAISGVLESAAMDVFKIRDFEIRNRLLVGTGKYATYELMQQALDASGCQVVTVAVRRERLVDKQGRSLLDFLDLDRYVILPNTAGCFSAEDAIRVSLLGRDLLEKNGNRGAGW